MLSYYIDYSLIFEFFWEQHQQDKYDLKLFNEIIKKNGGKNSYSIIVNKKQVLYFGIDDIKKLYKIKLELDKLPIFQEKIHGLSGCILVRHYRDIKKYYYFLSFFTRK